MATGRRSKGWRERPEAFHRQYNPRGGIRLEPRAYVGSRGEGILTLVNDFTHREVNPSLFHAWIPSGSVWMTSKGGCVIGVAGKISRSLAEPPFSSIAQCLPGISRAAR